MTEPTVLVVDTASPIVSLAVARRGEVLTQATLELRRTSERLLRTVQDALEGAGCKLSELHGIAALQGPGSFTGLRMGLATVLGWHQGLGLRATAIPTLPVLALSRLDDLPGGEVLAAVDAMRGDWMVQSFRLPTQDAAEATGWPTALGDSRLESQDDLAQHGQTPVVGFELPRLEGLETHPAPPLAPVAARWLSHPSVADASTTWQPERLIDPIYFRPPAVTLPRSASKGRRKTP